MVDLVMPFFYDVPRVMDIAPNAAGIPRMAFAVFSCPFEAMSYAARNRHLSPGGKFPLQVNRRPWARSIFESSRILDYRGCEVRFALRNRDGTFWTPEGSVYHPEDGVHFQKTELCRVRLDRGQSWHKVTR